MTPLRLALLLSLSTVIDASAQTSTWEHSLSHVAPGTVIVVDEAGIETKGRLVLLTADDLTIAVDDGRDQTFLRPRVVAVFQPGDSVKNGAMIGFLIGAGLGLRARNDGGCWNAQLTTQRPCTTKEHVGFAVINSAMAGGIGAGVGVLVDKLIPGRRRIYLRP